MRMSQSTVACLALAGSLWLGDSAFVLARERTPLQAEDPFASVFAAVEHGIIAGAVGQFSNHFAPQVYIYLRDGERGTYSAKQAFYVLDIFLRSHKSLGAKLTTFGGTESNPYATGNATFIAKGVRHETQLYIALVHRGDRWVITHLSIY
jgi:hypothetical protein